MNEVILTQDLVFVDQNEIYTDSLIVARVFEREHRTVLRDIRELIANAGEMIGLHNFVQSSYINLQGKKQPKFTLTKKALTLLIMGYTGKKAFQIKVNYIETFEKMESYIKNQCDLQSQLFKAMEKEEISFANGSMAGKYLQRRKMEKPIIKEEIESILQRLQIDMFDDLTIEKITQTIH